MTRSAATWQTPAHAHACYPCFHPLPESQPVLPCLLRRLLQKGKAKEALSLATSHSQAPHFARSLEWLLFTSLEINNEQMSRPSRYCCVSQSIVVVRGVLELNWGSAYSPVDTFARQCTAVAGHDLHCTRQVGFRYSRHQSPVSR